MNRHQSETSVETPWKFFWAVQEKLGIKFSVDVTADPLNSKCPLYITEKENAFAYRWRTYNGICWCNPPYDDIARWTTKAEMEAYNGANIVMLIPASVGSNWFYDHCWLIQRTIIINGRIQFVGHDDPYPKDLMLVCFGRALSCRPVVDIWRPAPHQLQ